MKTGALFAGYGGLEMAVNAWFGAETAWVSEIDPGACAILALVDRLAEEDEDLRGDAMT